MTCTRSGALAYKSFPSGLSSTLPIDGPIGMLAIDALGRRVDYRHRALRIRIGVVGIPVLVIVGVAVLVVVGDLVVRRRTDVEVRVPFWLTAKVPPYVVRHVDRLVDLLQGRGVEHKDATTDVLRDIEPLCRPGSAPWLRRPTVASDVSITVLVLVSIDRKPSDSTGIQDIHP